MELICRVFVVQGGGVRMERAGGAGTMDSIHCVFAMQTEQPGANLMASIRRVFTVRRRRNMNRRDRRDRQNGLDRSCLRDSERRKCPGWSRREVPLRRE